MKHVPALPMMIMLSLGISLTVSGQQCRPSNFLFRCTEGAVVATRTNTTGSLSRRGLALHSTKEASEKTENAR